MFSNGSVSDVCQGVLKEWSRDFETASSPPPTPLNGAASLGGSARTVDTLNGTNDGFFPRRDSSTAHIHTEMPLRKKGEVWVHIDAAYAGAALVTPEAQAATGMETLRQFYSFDVSSNFSGSCPVSTSVHV